MDLCGGACGCWPLASRLAGAAVDRRMYGEGRQPKRSVRHGEAMMGSGRRAAAARGRPEAARRASRGRYQGWNDGLFVPTTSGC